MANRYLKSRYLSYEQEPVVIYGSMVVGATGAVGTTKGGGVASIARTGTGAYTITLNDSFTKVLSFYATFGGGTASGIGGVELADTLANQTANAKLKQVKIQCYSATTTAADPAQNSIMQFRIELRNSSIGPWD